MNAAGFEIRCFVRYVWSSEAPGETELAHGAKDQHFPGVLVVKHTNSQ